MLKLSPRKSPRLVLLSLGLTASVAQADERTDALLKEHGTVQAAVEKVSGPTTGADGAWMMADKARLQMAATQLKDAKKSAKSAFKALMAHDKGAAWSVARDMAWAAGQGAKAKTAAVEAVNASTGEQQARAQVESGRIHAALGDWAVAMDTLSAAVDGASGDLKAIALSERGDAQRLHGAYLKAAEDFAAAMDLVGDTPSPAGVHVRLHHSEMFRIREMDAARKNALQDAVSMATEVYGPDHPQTGEAQELLGTYLVSYGKWAAYSRALEIYNNALGTESLAALKVQARMARVLNYRWSRDDDADQLLADVVPRLEAALGKKHPELDYPLEVWVDVKEDIGLMDTAVALNKRRLSSLTKSLGPDALATMNADVDRLAQMYRRKMYGEVAEEGPAAIAARAARLAKGEDGIQYLRDRLGRIQDMFGDEDAALATFQSIIDDTDWGGSSVYKVGLSHALIGNIHVERSNWEEAHKSYGEALRLWEATEGPNAADYAGALLNDLSNTFDRTGDTERKSRAYARYATLGDIEVNTRDIPTAEATLQAVSAMAVEGGERHAEAALSRVLAQLENISENTPATRVTRLALAAAQLHLLGRNDQATLLANAALDLGEQNLTRPPNERGDSMVTQMDFEGAAMNRALLGAVHHRMGNQKRAAQVLKDAGAALDAAPRKSTYSMQQARLALAAAQVISGTDKGLEQARDYVTTTDFKNAPEAVTMGFTVGTVAAVAGKQDMANGLFEAAMETCNAAARCATPSVGWAMSLAAHQAQAAGNPAEALRLGHQALGAWEDNTRLMTVGLLEQERFALARARRATVDLVAGLDDQNHALVANSVVLANNAAIEAALDLPVPKWEPHPASEAVDKARSAARRLARYNTLVFDPPQGEVRASRMGEMMDEIAASIEAAAAVDPAASAGWSATSTGFGAACQALPKGTALVMLHQTPEANLAFVATGGRCEGVKRISLSSGVDVAGLHNAATSQDLPAYQKHAQSLYDAVWKPLASTVSGAATVVVARDGAFSGIPFAGLHDGKRYLAEKHRFVYAHSPGDLSRWQANSKTKDDVLVLHNADVAVNLLDAPGFSLDSSLGGTCTIEPSAVTVEGVELLGDATVLTGDGARESAVQSAGLVVLGGNGFWCDAHAFGPTPTGTGNTTTASLKGESPLRNIGVTLAGSGPGSHSLSGRLDGYLTAEEIAATDLQGTRTLWIPAQNHANLPWLESAVAQSGARSLVTNIWSAPTEGLAKVLASGPSASAVGTLQVKAAKAGDAPWQWAGVMVSGDWR